MKKINRMILIGVVFLLVFGSECWARTEPLVENYVANPEITEQIRRKPSLIEDQLRVAMERLLNNPATLTIELVHLSDEETALGCFEKVIVRTSGGNVENLLLHKADVQFNRVQINTKRLFEEKKIEPVKIDDIIMDVIITEADLNSFLKHKAKSIKVDRPKIVLRRDQMRLSGSTRYGIIRADFSARGRLYVKNKDEIWFNSNRIELNRMTMPRSFVGMLMKKINPVLNLKSFPFKLELTEINTLPGKIEFTSRR